MAATITAAQRVEGTEFSYVSRFSGKRVHFIGIGGCGMSGLARILHDAGAIVTGSEPKPGPATFELARRGIHITRDQIGEQLELGIDLVVRTAAVKDDNPEFQSACALGLPHLKYAQLLGEVMQERLGVAVAGTHGKSTTTAMIAYALTHTDQSPSWVVGGTVDQLGGSSASGRGKAFVVEACEFDRSFHNLHPSVALVTNIEADHLDCYKDLYEIIESFRGFLQLVPPDGLVLCNGADSNVARVLTGVSAEVHTVAIQQDATWSVRQVRIVDGLHCGVIVHDGREVAELRLGVAGLHNLFNGAMAVAACFACGVSPDRAAEALRGFTGVARRMTRLGTYRGATIVDDYAHHPTEIRATLAAIRQQYQPKRLFCVFQPHQHSRTRLLLEEFAGCFAAADSVLLPDIYNCRDTEADRQAINSAILAGRISANGVDACYIPGFPSLVGHLKCQLSPGDLVVTMGAGNVYEIGRELIELNIP